MTVLTPSPSPTTLLSKSSSSSSSQTYALLTPALNSSLFFAAYLHQLLFLRFYVLSSLILQQTYIYTQLLATQSYLFSALVGRYSRWAVRRSWKTTERMRRKLFFEFMVFVLGAGNGLILVLFWPGWVLVGGGFWGVWKVCG